MTKNMTMIVNMKSGLVFAALALVAAGCGKNIEYDACGQVDATQVTVSAENAGRVLSMAVEEGEVVTAGQLLGALDSVQTYLQIMELRERIAAVPENLKKYESDPAHAFLAAEAAWLSEEYEANGVTSAEQLVVFCRKQ